MEVDISKKLYQYDSKGRERVWWIEAIDNHTYTYAGLVDGKKTCQKRECKAKNVGKSNETTPEQQAVLEAESRWKHQILRKDYHWDIEQSGLQLRPTLAHKYNEHMKKVDFLSHWVSPKLDGLRLLAGNRQYNEFWDSTHFEFMTREGDNYDLPHLEKDCQNLLKDLEVEFGGKCLALDGEVYLHGLSLQQINSRSRKYQEGLTEELEYHLFDLVIDDVSYEEKFKVLQHLLDKKNYPKIKLVPVHDVHCDEDVKKLHQDYVFEGYEGVMVRNHSTSYEVATRSYNLMKYKEMQDRECKIVGMNKDANGLAVLVCEYEYEGETKQVEVTPKRSHEERKKMIDNLESFIGQWITVQFQSYTDDGILQFPVGLNLRECDEQGNPIV